MRGIKEKTHEWDLRVLEPCAFEGDKPAVQVCKKIGVGLQGDEFFKDSLETVSTGTKRL
jgi:hypothetical protein